MCSRLVVIVAGRTEDLVVKLGNSSSNPGIDQISTQDTVLDPYFSWWRGAVGVSEFVKRAIADMTARFGPLPESFTIRDGID